MKFDLGQLVSTPGALEALKENNVTIMHYILRHARGDWGDIDDEDKEANEAALKQGSRLLSAYLLPDKTKLWIITEWDRSVTTLLLPEEY